MNSFFGDNDARNRIVQYPHILIGDLLNKAEDIDVKKVHKEL